MLQNKLVFLTLEVLKITMEAESTSSKKKRSARGKDTVQTTELLSDHDEYINDSDVESEGSMIVIARIMRS